MACFFLLLADAAPAVDPTVWGGAAVGGVTSLSLLAGLLWWIAFRHLPAKDQQLKEVVDAKDKLLKEIVDAKDKLLKDFVDAKDRVVADLISKFADGLEADRAACENRHEKLMAQKNINHQEAIAQMNLHHERVLNRMDKHHEGQMESQKEHRHAIKDMGQLLAVANAINEERDSRRRDGKPHDDDGA